MQKSVIEAKVFHDEIAAYAWVEKRVWPNGPICPHCGGTDHIGKMAGNATRVGLYKCYQCRKQFTVKVGTVFEASHVPMRFWVQAMYLLCSSKKGVSSNQLSRTRHSQDCVVHVAPYPRGNVCCWYRAHGRRWRRRRSG
jgi:transposase-like protein